MSISRFFKYWLFMSACVKKSAFVMFVMMSFSAKGEDSSFGSVDLIQQIETYFNSFQSLAADFIQVNHNGVIQNGKFYLSRPGKMRIDYKPPSKLMILADGTWLTHFDGELDQVSRVSLRSSPAEIILRPMMRLQGDVEVMNLSHDRGVIRVTLRKKSEPGAGAISLVFSDNPISLKQWVILDAQGLQTMITLENVQTGVRFEKDTFKVPY